MHFTQEAYKFTRYFKEETHKFVFSVSHTLFFVLFSHTLPYIDAVYTGNLQIDMQRARVQCSRDISKTMHTHSHFLSVTHTTVHRFTLQANSQTDMQRALDLRPMQAMPCLTNELVRQRHVETMTFRLICLGNEI